MESVLKQHDFDFIAIGCSAGGIEGLRFLLSEIPPQFSIPIGVVQHRSANSKGMMTRYFTENCALKIIEPDDKEPIEAGCVYFAPANYHMMVGDDRAIHLSVDEPVYFSRPSIDVFFQSAAQVYKNRLLGAVLSGANVDGSAGLKDIKYWGGCTVVQDPKTASHKTMPEAALAGHTVDLVLDLVNIRQLIHSLVKKGA